MVLRNERWSQTRKNDQFRKCHDFRWLVWQFQVESHLIRNLNELTRIIGNRNFFWESKSVGLTGSYFKLNFKLKNFKLNSTWNLRAVGAKKNGFSFWSVARWVRDFVADADLFFMNYHDQIIESIDEGYFGNVRGLDDVAWQLRSSERTESERMERSFGDERASKSYRLVSRIDSGWILSHRFPDWLCSFLFPMECKFSRHLVLRWASNVGSDWNNCIVQEWRHWEQHQWPWLIRRLIGEWCEPYDFNQERSDQTSSSRRLCQIDNWSKVGEGLVIARVESGARLCLQPSGDPKIEWTSNADEPFPSYHDHNAKLCGELQSSSQLASYRSRFPMVVNATIFTLVLFAPIS